MADRPTPEAELVEHPPYGGPAHDAPDGAGRDVSDDEVAAALAAVFNLSAEDAGDDDASEWAPPPPVAAGPEPAFLPEWAPAAASVPAPPAADLPADDAPAPPDGEADASGWWDEEPGDHPGPPASEPGRSTAALQEAGFGGPLHSALGELGRIIPERGVGTAPDGEETDVAVPAAMGAETQAYAPPERRGPEWLSVAGLRQAWADHRRDWGPGLIVAALVVVAFVVVLAAGGRDDSPSRVDSRPRPTAVPTTANVATTLFDDPLLEEVPVDPGLAAPLDGSGTPGAPSVTPRRRASGRPAATSPPATQARPRPGAAATPTPTAAPPADQPDDPPDDGPTATAPPPQTTLPPATAPPTTRFDPCDLIQDPRAQQECRRQNR